MPRVADTKQRVRLDPEERRRQILLAAAHLFRRRLYSEVSISDIAAEAGVARGLLHHYFGSKRELYLEVVRESSHAVLDDDDTTELGTDEAWSTVVDRFLDSVAANPRRWLDATNAGRPERDGEVAAILDETREILVDQTLRTLGLEDRAGEPMVRAFVRAWGGFVQELTVEWVLRERIDRDHVHRTLLKTLPLLVERVLPELDRS